MIRNLLFVLPVVVLLGCGLAVALHRCLRREYYSRTHLVISPSAVLSIRLQHGLGRTAPTYRLCATLPYFLLSRKQVRDFYRLLCEMKSPPKKKQGSSPPQKDSEEDSYDLAENTLEGKIRFVPRAVHLQYPAILAFLTLSPKLTRDEFEVLTIQVMYLAQDLDTYDAVWFTAQSSYTEKVYHLVRKEHRARSGQVLCGCRPPSPGNASTKGWIFFPVKGSLEKDNLCPSCLERWEREPQPSAFIPMEQSNRRQGGEVWYEV